MSSGYDVSRDPVVIAVVIECRGRIALFKRSGLLGHGSGLWHCITGFMEAEATPRHQTLAELSEETGLQADDLLELRQGPDLVADDDFGTPRLVYTFTAVTSRRRLEINWEHDSYRWTNANKAKRFVNRVTWLDNVLEATGHYPATVPAARPGVRQYPHSVSVSELKSMICSKPVPSLVPERQSAAPSGLRRS